MNHKRILRFITNISKRGRGNSSKQGSNEDLLSLIIKTLSPTLTVPPWSSIPRFMPKNGAFPYSSFSLGSKDDLKWKEEIHYMP